VFNKKTIDDIDPSGKRVLVRVDFNVPIENGVVTDDTRIRAALPTLIKLRERGAALILCSHLGRPKGAPEQKYSLRPVSEYLEKLLDTKVDFVNQCIGQVAEEASHKLKSGEILVLENTRFEPGETKNDPGMAKGLAKLGEIYVNDAFGSAHRAHASTEGVAHYLPGVAGYLMKDEIQYLGKALNDPLRPFIAILGGAKVSDKIEVIRNLLTKADKVLIGGGMANTFLVAKGYQMAASLVEEVSIGIAKELLESGEKILLPLDLVIADSFQNNAKVKVVDTGDIQENWRALDIGPKTVEVFGKEVISARTIVWNGPMGVFEMESFARGTFSLAEAVASSKAVSIVGGGDSVAALQRSGLAHKITHISTGGGASLEMMAGKTLPGLTALQDKEN
jgi:phosphoglycerate kinase